MVGRWGLVRVKRWLMVVLRACGSCCGGRVVVGGVAIVEVECWFHGGWRCDCWGGIVVVSWWFYEVHGGMA